MQDEPKAELPGNAEQQTLEHVESEVKLSRRKRGVVPIVGMPCAPGYKQVGDECVMANVDFE
ncbi:hypothetical protein CHR29_10995 [Pseudomonas monteilii]|uniref:Uncharacterized protein n=1 Tax=Pseudomonas monteilii TaxID=76759 RepID=A0AAP7KF78_9PSED|nr:MULTISPECIES: hypothetical protein [Pseudomonas]AYN15639.1 hypothetical protein CHR29_10995 [Pseudomonas monteilii]AYO00702.1 hypothetical protein D8767_17780 [Pseudomonas sp. LTGT-11-2Z]MBA1318432.1 hypothetical protein [Pseudomonas monteilii]MBA6090450.1 hypothetical protein [Pseudomonas monteilii]MBA6103562.1 hypothetical protein [Pseudomonas monteilii]